MIHPEPRLEILLVDDSEADVALTLRALKKRNLANQVMVARDGVEALELLLPDPPITPAPRLPRVILLDLKMPRLSGLEVLTRLKQDERTRAIPVVVLTSSNQEPDIAASYALGANSYIVKPVDFGAFASAVADIGMYWLLLNHPTE